jgi:hypothetical protein
MDGYASLILTVSTSSSPITVVAYVEHDGKINCFLKGSSRLFNNLKELIEFVKENY